MGTSEFILTTESTVVEELERLAQMILFPFRLLESSLSPDHCDRPVVVEEIVETATRGWTLLSVIEELNLVDSRTFQSGSFGVIHSEIWRCCQLWFVKNHKWKIAERIFQHSMSNGDIYSVTLRNFLIRDGSDAMLESLMNSWMDKENYGITDSFIQTGMINNLVGNIKFCMEERNPSMDSGGLVQSWTYKMSLAAVANVDDQLACINSFFEDKEKLEDHLYLNE